MIHDTLRVVDENFGLTLKIPGPIEQFHVEQAIAAHHYLKKYPDPRCMSFPYSVYLHDEWIGCLVFGRPQAGKLFKGPFTYGSLEDMEKGRAKYCRWEVLNLSRVWFSPLVQHGGSLCRRDLIPGFTDRKGSWRPSLASVVVRASLQMVRTDYLMAYPPVFFQRYNILSVLSYCDTRLHKGTIYRASGFDLASCNRDKIETYTIEGIPRLTEDEDASIRAAGRHHPRSVKKRNAKSFYLPPSFFM